jgi:hypothetical protein
MRLKTDIQGMFPDCCTRVKIIKLKGSEAHAKSSLNDIRLDNLTDTRKIPTLPRLMRKHTI